jgi:transcriptional regulator with XRE-family HTH domain
MPGTPDDGAARLRLVDCHIGERLRQRRVMLGLSQAQLGEAAGMVFQQIQKYEKGSNRIAVSQLFRFSQILSVPISFFYEGIPQSANRERKTAGSTAIATMESNTELLQGRETLELLRSYQRIGDKRLRRNIYVLIRSMSSDEG